MRGPRKGRASRTSHRTCSEYLCRSRGVSIGAHAPNGGTARYSPSPRLELVASFGKKFVHLLAQILPRQGDTMALEIAEKFAEHVFIAGLVQIGTDDLLGISLCFSAADVHQFCRPKPEQLVAPSGHTEVLFVSVTVVFFVQLAL